MMASNDSPQYHGHRVSAMNPIDIESVAKHIVKKFNITRDTINNMDRLIEDLWHKSSIVVDIVDDDKWLDCANALCDPNIFQIAIPSRLYEDMTSHSSRKRKAKAEAIRIFFHELGHLSLSHKAVLHHSDNKWKLLEDSEWQADYFADIIMTEIGNEGNRQLKLFE